jgi:hypothetical protein
MWMCESNWVSGCCGPTWARLLCARWANVSQSSQNLPVWNGPMRVLVHDLFPAAVGQQVRHVHTTGQCEDFTWQLSRTIAVSCSGPLILDGPMQPSCPKVTAHNIGQFECLCMISYGPPLAHPQAVVYLDYGPIPVVACSVASYIKGHISLWAHT